MVHGWPSQVLLGGDDEIRGRVDRVARSLHAGLRVIEAIPDGRDRLREQVQLVLMPMPTSPAALAQLRRAFPTARMIVFGGDASQQAAIEAFRSGADDFVARDLDEGQLARLLAGHLDSDVHADAPDGLAGRSAALTAVRDYALRLAPSNVSVLVTGETGTGKDCLAVLLHRRGRRAGGPLVALNCAAIPDGLLEGELFGYERGAFSGAVAAYPGKLKLADGGTLLLDEIGELSLAGQAKLLRAIETREVYRLGATAPTHFDARIVATTNRDLRAEVEAGNFREDLFYRVAVARIELPPLRDRVEDIMPIARHLLRELAAASSLRVPAIASDVEAVLEGHDWPGNVRELRNVIEIALVTCNGAEITAADLPPHLAPRAPAVPQVSGELGVLLQALERAGGNKSVAAKALSCSRMTLYRKLARHGLVEEPAIRSLT
jgi:DNA-binding NtrC family response regulator